MPTIADNFNLETDQPLDARTVWPTVQAALLGIKPGQRTTAMFVRILADGGQWYSFQGGVTDEHFRPAPFEQLKRYFAQLPTPDTVRDTQDIPVGTCATFKTAVPEAGWIPVVPGSRFDRIAYPTLYAALGTDVLPNESSLEGNVYIKAEQVSTARTDAMTPFNFVGGVYDQKIANVLAQFNTLIADLNYNEEIRKTILETTIGPPAVATESLTTLNAWLLTLKRMLVALLNDKYIPARQTEPFYDLIQKIDSIRIAEEDINPGVNVQCRIGETVVAAECPGPGWIESDGTPLDHPDTTGRPLLWPEYYDYFYNALGYAIAPLTLTVPAMTSMTLPMGRVKVYKGDTQTAVSVTNAWHWFNRSTSTVTVAGTAYSWDDPDPLYVEYEFKTDDKTNTRPKNIRRLGLTFQVASASCAYPTHFSVQGYDPKRGIWIDLMSTGDFEPVQTKEYRFDFPNEHLVTSIRLKMTAGTIFGSNTLTGISGINFYEYVPFDTPAVSTPQRKVWVKVATTGNDLGLKPMKYRVSSNRIARNDVIFLDDYSTNTTPSRVPFAGAVLNAGIAYSSPNSFDVADFEYEGRIFHFFGSALAQVSTSAYYMISYFTDETAETTAAPTPVLCFPSNSSYSAAGGTPARFFRYKDKLYFVAGNYHVWRLDYPDRLKSAPTSAWVRVMNTNIRTAELFIYQDVYHFNDGETHYSYHILGAAPWLKLYRWDLANFTEPVEVAMSPSLDLAYLNRSGAAMRFHFFRHRGKLFFLCWDQTASLLKMFRQDAPETMTLLKTRQLPYAVSGSSPYLAFPSHEEMFLWNDQYVFGCGYQQGDHSPLMGAANARSTTMIGMYDFDRNEFEFPDMKTYIGNRSIAHDFNSFSRIVKIRGEYYLFSVTPASLTRIDMDRRALLKGEPIQSPALSFGTFQDVFFLAERYLLHFNGGAGTVFDFERPRIVSFNDMLKLGAGKATGRTLVALDSAIAGQYARCQDLVPWPLQMVPQIPSTATGIGSWNDYILPR